MSAPVDPGDSDGWIRTIADKELPEAQPKSVDAGGEPVVLVRVGGRIHAMGGICQHAGWDLGLGSVEGTKLTCAGHGAIWDLTTGRAEFDEELDPEPLYDVHLADGFIFVRRRN